MGDFACLVQNQVKTQAGVSGTATFNSGDVILCIKATGGSGGTIALPNGLGGIATIPVPDALDWTLREGHTARVMSTAAGGLTIVFASTVSYFVEYYSPS
jgi:hypothetical protein